MSHTIYTSRGIVLALHYLRDADVSLTVLTEKYGLISIFVKSAREVRSKLSGHIQLFSMGEYDMIRSHMGWRLTGAHSYGELSRAPQYRIHKNTLLKRSSQIIRLVVHGEESDPELFLWLYNVLTYVATTPEVNQTPSWLYGVELVCVAHIMHVLGYLDPAIVNAPTMITSSSVLHALENTDAYVRGINAGLEASHLV